MAAWNAGNFQNHQRLLRDLVVGSGQIGVFVEYSPLPAVNFPTQLEESYAALKWVLSTPASLAETAVGSPSPAIQSAAT